LFFIGFGYFMTGYRFNKTKYQTPPILIFDVAIQ